MADLLFGWIWKIYTRAWFAIFKYTLHMRAKALILDLVKET